MFLVEKRVEIDHWSSEVQLTEYVSTEREARRAAARMLGRETLRGAVVWRLGHGITVFRFSGPQDVANGHQFVVMAKNAEKVLQGVLTQWGIPGTKRP